MNTLSAPEETATLTPRTSETQGVNAPALIFTIPRPDLMRFASLPESVRDEVHALLSVMREIHARGQVNPVCKEQSRFFNGKRGTDWSSLRRKWYAFAREGWTALVDWSKAGGGSGGSQRNRGLSQEFIEWFKALAERNQRKTRPAHRVFKQLWFAGEDIPGLDNSLPRHELPPGTGYANLSKKVSNAFALAVMRRGMGAAMKHAPQVLTTRAGLWPMSHVMIDDLWHDNFVVYRGQPVRVLEFDAIDVLSACKIGWGTKPRLPRDDGSLEGLQEKFVRMLLAQIFFQHGFSPRGTTLLAEHGTAAVREELEKLLFDRTEGKITVRRSGINGREQAVKGMFPGRGGGNPRFKSPLESLRNLIHNELAALPAQTGMSVEARPEQLHGELNHNSDLLKAVAVLAETKPERAALIQLSLLQYHAQFLPLLADVYETINRRDWHELEGWHKCGFVLPELNDAGHWVSPESLQPIKREALLALARVDRSYSREHRLSPRAVFERGVGLLEKLPAFVVAEILGNDFAREEKCADGYFQFQDQELDPEPLRFESRIMEPDGHERELNGDTYMVFVNPFDLQQLFVHDARGRHLGIARRQQRACRADDAALERSFGRRNQRLLDLLKPIRARHAGITREAAKRDAHNARVLEESGVVPADRTTDHGPRTTSSDCTRQLLAEEAEEITLPED